LQQGFPMSIGASDNGGLLDSYGYNRADWLGSPKKLKFSTTNKYAAQDLALFTQPAFGTYGTSGRNIVNMPGIANYDMGFYKNLAITERANFQLRFESFNTFNHPQFYQSPATGGGSTVVNSVDNANFGQITGAADGRIIQIGGKFTF
jgi:hypothetical protein